MRSRIEHPHCSRRKVLALGVGYILAGNGRFPAFAEPPGLMKVSRRSRALGSEVTLTVLHEARSRAEGAIDAAFRELEKIESVLSLYRAESDVCRLNRDGSLVDPHPHLLRVLKFAQNVSTQSDGAFDITVQPLWEIFHAAAQRGAMPDHAVIAEARGKIGWRRVRISKGQVALAVEGAAITLNGIAQGYAADCVKNILAGAGIAHALIDCGEISALGKTADDAPWQVGIQHPREEDAFISVARLSGRCLATSGDYATRFGGGDGDAFRWHHLFDPKTGRSPTQLASVSVAARTAMEADALSTAVFVAGAERGRKLIEEFPGADALLVMKNGRTLATKGFPCES